MPMPPALEMLQTVPEVGGWWVGGGEGGMKHVGGKVLGG